MSTNNKSPYDNRDYAIMSSHIFNELCLRDKEDRAKANPPAWHDINELAKGVGAYIESTDVAYLAEFILKDEKGLIEGEQDGQNVRLTQKGRENCAKGISIPQPENRIKINL